MKQKSRKQSNIVREILETIALAFVIFVVVHFAIQSYYVDGISMEPSLHNTEHIMVNKLAYLFHAPQRGDVIIFVAPPDPNQDYVKRIIAIPGDVITIKGTTVIVDGVTLDETYVAPQDQGNPYSYKKINNVVVPPNDYFVLGDNRAVSDDSRAWGFVPRANIIGEAAFVYWPLNANNLGFLPSASSVFAHVHQEPSGGLGSHTPYRPIPLDSNALLLFLAFDANIVLALFFTGK